MYSETISKWGLSNILNGGLHILSSDLVKSGLTFSYLFQFFAPVL